MSFWDPHVVPSLDERDAVAAIRSPRHQVELDLIGDGCDACVGGDTLEDDFIYCVLEGSLAR